MDSVDHFLAGVRVLDATEALAGPYCTAILSDLGAEVIKVERLTGDPMRTRGKGRMVSLPFTMVQRNKKSIALDFTDVRGRDVLLRLLETADIFVQNFRPGVLEKYALAYEDLKAAFPQLIYCSISGFGQTGPLREAGGVDLIAQGYAGLMSVTGFADRGPAKAGYPVSDVGAGMWAVIGVLAALERCRRIGVGAHIDVALTDSIFAWSVWEVADYQMTGQVPGPLGTAHRLIAPYQAFICGDGKWLTVAAAQTHWHKFCEILCLSRLIADERFISEYSRFEHREELAAELQPAFRLADQPTWLSRLREAGVPCGPVHDIASLMQEPQFAARQMIAKLETDSGQVGVINSPIKSDGAPGVMSPAPGIGQHTVELLAEIGLSELEIRDLATGGVVNAPELTER